MNDYSNPATYWETRLAARFDLAGAGYATLGPRYNARMYQARLDALERALAAVNRSLKGTRVLEVGCGTGFYTDYCARQGVADYVGLDITEVSVVTLRQRYPKFTFLQADVTNGTLNLEMAFGIVLAADVLFHIVDEKAFCIAMQNICRWVEPKGLLILSDVFPPVTVRTALHCRHYALNKYEQLLAAQGLSVAHIEPIFAILHPPPLILGTSFVWRAYAWLWRYGWRLARWSLADWALPTTLGWLDEHFFLPRFGLHAPNSKWLLAVKH